MPSLLDKRNKTHSSVFVTIMNEQGTYLQSDSLTLMNLAPYTNVLHTLFLLKPFVEVPVCNYCIEKSLILQPDRFL